MLSFVFSFPFTPSLQFISAPFTPAGSSSPFHVSVLIPPHTSLLLCLFSDINLHLLTWMLQFPCVLPLSVLLCLSLPVSPSVCVWVSWEHWRLRIYELFSQTESSNIPCRQRFGKMNDERFKYYLVPGEELKSYQSVFWKEGVNPGELLAIYVALDRIQDIRQVK